MLRRLLPLLLTGGLLAGCSSSSAVTVEFDGATCHLSVPEGADATSVRMVNRSTESVWFGAGGIAQDMTAEEMLTAVDARSHGSTEAVMALFLPTRAGFATEVRPGGTFGEGPILSAGGRLAVWCVTPPDGSDTAYLGGILGS
jgi:hypothetical protein